jgi:hypothetical protein
MLLHPGWTGGHDLYTGKQQEHDCPGPGPRAVFFIISGEFYLQNQYFKLGQPIKNKSKPSSKFVFNPLPLHPEFFGLNS